MAGILKMKNMFKNGKYGKYFTSSSYFAIYFRSILVNEIKAINAEGSNFEVVTLKIPRSLKKAYIYSCFGNKLLVISNSIFSIIVQDSCYQPMKIPNSDLFTKLIPTGACGEHGRCISTSFKDFYCDCNNGWKGERCQTSA